MLAWLQGPSGRIDTVLALGFGNRLYTQADPARRLPQLWECYYENPAPPTTPDALAAWQRYVRFMARNFGPRVRYFELWNEWNIAPYWGDKPDVARYLGVARAAIPVLREAAPRAKIMNGSTAGFCFGISGWSAEELAQKEKTNPFLIAVAELLPHLDVIGWHPFYQADPDTPRARHYAADIRTFQRWCRARGFRGEYMATEWGYASNYPATALEGVRPSAFACRIEACAGEVECFTMRRAGDRLAALWRPGRAVDNDPGTPATLRIHGRAGRCTAYDPLNGREYGLTTVQAGNSTCLPQLLIRDYPLIVRLME